VIDEANVLSAFDAHELLYNNAAYSHLQKQPGPNPNSKNDPCCILLSAAVQEYMTKAMVRGIESARGRQNLDGLRLWYMQHMSDKPPPLGLKLGCDVKRQVARVMGDAAMLTSKMEDQLAKRSTGTREGTTTGENQVTAIAIESSGTMVDMAKKPVLSGGGDVARMQANEYYRVWNGSKNGGGVGGRGGLIFGKVPLVGSITETDIEFD
jgi:hypothetical protein